MLRLLQINSPSIFLFFCNDPDRAEALREEYISKREKYCGLPIVNDLPFDTELVSTVILKLKRPNICYFATRWYLLFCLNFLEF